MDEVDVDEPEETGLDLDCPTCREVQPHRVLRAAAAGWTVQCVECGDTRTLPAPRQVRMTRVPLILSEGPTSRSLDIEVPLDLAVRVDEETEVEGHRVRVTAIEVAGGARVNSSPGRAIRTLYAVIFDTVRLNYTVNQGEVTMSYQEDVEPEEEVHIGMVRDVGDVRLVVKTLKSDQNRTLHKGYLLARNIRRVFADVAGARARPGQRVGVRKRGAPPGARRIPRR